jgi:hypothetical protein
VLATLLAPDAGRAEVFGRDVVHEAAAVRELLGLTRQFAAVDEILSGRPKAFCDLGEQTLVQADAVAVARARVSVAVRGAGRQLTRRPPAAT